MHRLWLSAVSVVALAAAPAFGQNFNTILRSKLDTHSGYNAVHGIAKNGIEIAVWGTTSGTAWVDATDPDNPVEIAFFPGPGSTWRDMDNWGDYVYVVTEGGGGLQIIDATNPLSPVFVGSWTGVFNNAHTMYIDKTTGMAYMNGTNAGMVVADLTQDPENPVFVTELTSPYAHDSFSQNGYLHHAAINNGVYRLYDNSSLPSINLLDQVSTPNFATHNVWANADDTRAYTSDEAGGGHMAIWDITTKTNVQKLGEWSPFTGAIIHNVYVKGNVAHCAWYADGYYAVDVSSSTAPRRLASFDTNPASGGSFTGAWGAYPFQPSGVVYVNDTSNGLFILDVPCLPLAHYGTGLAGGGGFTPQLAEPSGLANLGNLGYAIRAVNLEGGQPGLFVLGLNSASIPAFGGTFLVDPNGMVTSSFTASGSGSGNGQATMSLPVPNLPALDGLSLYVQALVVDPAAPQGVAMSDGGQIQFCILPPPSGG